MIRDLILGMAGAGGDGVITTGELLLEAAALEGRYGMLTKAYGPQIRGGESSFRLRLCESPPHTPGAELDLAIALSWSDFKKFADLRPGPHTRVLHDASVAEELPADFAAILQPQAITHAPLAALAKEAGAARSRNLVALGILSAWIGVGESSLAALLGKKFQNKGEAVLTATRRAFEVGRAWGRANPPARDLTFTNHGQDEARPLLVADGNFLAGAGAIFAGCEFFAGYPITPASEIMHFMSEHIWKFGGSMLQMEDEIASVGAALGASFAGKKALTATSGPGMDLKSEILGLASMAELPLVIIDVQRGGPATGLPTQSEQSDLFQAAFSAHGDVVRPVLAPTSAADMFQMTVQAFNLAEEFQTPVILLSDQMLGQRKEALPPIDAANLPVSERRRAANTSEPYQRFRLSDGYISPLAAPGEPERIYQISGLEHGENARPAVNGAAHASMSRKRLEKFRPLASERFLAERGLFDAYGPAAAKLAFIAWGSSAGAAREALEELAARGTAAKLLTPRLLHPVPADLYRDFLFGARRAYVIEQNAQGQLLRLLRMYDALPPGVDVQSFARPAGSPLGAHELILLLERDACLSL
jgi:2-oxoglutarate ferredoxin oxidoreductase subunit alpha